MNLLFNSPVPLAVTHLLNAFACGEPPLDEWLKRRALASQASGACRTFVATDRSGLVKGYYAIAAGAISHQMATGSLRRNMPDPIPVLVLARLAVDKGAQGMKLGAGLLQDAVSRAMNVALNAGVRALVVHALHEQAKMFYERFGFRESPQHPMTLMLRLNIPKA
jgi:predicted N-acetyltransferase YhbS